MIQKSKFLLKISKIFKNKNVKHIINDTNVSFSHHKIHLRKKARQSRCLCTKVNKDEHNEFNLLCNEQSSRDSYSPDRTGSLHQNRRKKLREMNFLHLFHK